jgi:hypothetical protein
MKQMRCTLVILCLILATEGSHAQQRKFGLGLIIGEPTGISAKLWTSPENALDFGLGWSYGGDRVDRYYGYYDGGQRVHFHIDYLWHSFNAIRSTERFPLYYGVGAHLNSGAGYDDSFAIRGVFGIAWLPHTTPIDIFLELVPSLQLTYYTGFALDAGVGIRYYF